MGIDLTCDTKSFGCAYSGWHSFRTCFVEATFAYLRDYLANLPFDENNEPAITNLQKYLQNVEDNANKISAKRETAFMWTINTDRTAKDCLIESFITEVSAHEWFGELLIQFGAAGIYALCNKSDCEGFYSVGNSLDICDLLRKIIPFIPSNEDSTESIYSSSAKELLEVFEESVEKQTAVIIH